MYVTALVFPVQLQQISLRLIEFLRKEGVKLGEGVHPLHLFPEGFKGDVCVCVCRLKIESQPQTVNLP